jgi:hypothetical protein
MADVEVERQGRIINIRFNRNYGASLLNTLNYSSPSVRAFGV